MFADNNFNKHRRKVGKLPNQKVKFKKSSTIAKKARVGLNSDLTLYTNSADLSKEQNSIKSITSQTDSVSQNTSKSLVSENDIQEALGKRSGAYTGVVRNTTELDKI